MKLTLALLFVAFAAGAQVKSDTVTFTPKPDQLKTLQQFDAQIEQLRKQQMELILLLIGEPIDPKTLVFDGKKFKAMKVK
jgi:hypothetical protein